MPISRRDMLLAGTAALLAPAFPGRAQSVPTAAEFLALSEKLTGVQGLDAAAAKPFLDGLLSTGRGQALSALIGGATGAEAERLGNAIVGGWYSGLYDTPAGPAVATYEDALVWSALDFTKPCGVCGGDTGYWADPA